MAYVDINADGIDDILWYSRATGDIGYWQGSNSGNYAWTYLGAIGTANDYLIDVGTYFGNTSRSDIAFLDWRNAYSNTNVRYWDMNSNNTFTDTTLGGSATAAAGWERIAIEGSSDYTGDGYDDLLVRGASGTAQEGQIWIADTNGAGGSSWIYRGLINETWKPIYSNDFDGDLRDDILWQNQDTGYLGFWDSGAGYTWTGLGMGSTDRAGAQWRVFGTGDFTNDGSADILWYDTATNHIGYWDLANGAWTQWGDFGGAVAGENWFIQQIGDFTGDGYDDVLWRENTTGAVGMWDVNDAFDNWSWVYLGQINWQWDLIQT